MNGTCSGDHHHQSETTIPLECIFCIAKRIFVGSNNEIVSKVQLSDRFNHLDEGFANLKVAQYENFMIWSNMRARKMVPYSIQQLQLNDIGGIILNEEEGSEAILNDDCSPSQFIDPGSTNTQQLQSNL